MAEWAGVVVGHAHPQGRAGLLPGLIDQGRGNDVLNPRSGVAPSYSDQELETVGGHRDGGGRHEGKQREDSSSGPIGVATTLSQEEGLEIVAKGDRDDREVGAQGKHREQGQENVQRKQKPGVGR